MHGEVDDKNIGSINDYINTCRDKISAKYSGDHELLDALVIDWCQTGKPPAPIVPAFAPLIYMYGQAAILIKRHLKSVYDRESEIEGIDVIREIRQALESIPDSWSKFAHFNPPDWLSILKYGHFQMSGLPDMYRCMHPAEVRNMRF